MSSPIDNIATSPCDQASIPSLIDGIAKYQNTTSLENNEHGRLELLKTARSLVRALETPRETIIRLCWAETTLYGGIDTAIKLRLFEFMSECPKTVGLLAELTDADPALLSRIMKHLASMGVIQETGADEYKHTNLSKTLTVPKYADGFPCIATSAAPALYKLPEYLSQAGYKNPTEATNGPFQYAFNTTNHWFNWAQDHQPVLAQFNNHMGAYHQGRPSWMDPDFYPVQDRLVNGARTDDPEAVFLVDVGGSLGHDLVEFRSKHSHIPGRLVLQDLPSVVEQVRDLPGDIESMAYDFFTEQPVKGARAYYLHSILHDWPNKDCMRILSQITAAMVPGYSRLLISENVIPDVGADWQVTGQDLMMMTMVSSQERKEQEWRRLLESAGLKVLEIWRHEPGVESLIECELN